ncbi:putative DNA-binding domain-containing protein [Schlesneria sp. T3-172]|uniref:HvfC/BufC family peptide modification chaperone n=1 Tax=Schlesneria sphaerica TaxID=3373610 RepID=UPI0037CBBA5D
MSSGPPPLDVIQSWLQSVITDPLGIEAGIASSPAMERFATSVSDVESVILPSQRLSSLDRLRIYGNAYFGRLLDCLRSQFPAVRQAAGDDAFDGLAFGYLVSHPSKSYTLAELGTSFESYLRSTRPPRESNPGSAEFDFADFLIDLTRLEAVYNDVFDGPGPERVPSLSADSLAGLSPEKFAASVLRFHASVRLREFGFPVHEYATAVRRGTPPTLPNPRPVYLVITRRDYIVRRFEVTRSQYHLLSALYQQQPVGVALQTLCGIPEFDLDSLKNDLQHWFREWTAAPLFAEVLEVTPANAIQRR